MFAGEFEKFFGYKSIVSGLLIQQEGVKVANDAYRGDSAWVQGYATDAGDWKGENVVKIEDGKWWGWIGTSEIRSIDGWIELLTEKGEDEFNIGSVEGWRANTVLFLNVGKNCRDSVGTSRRELN